jgi:hypothetical protein
MYKLVVEGGYFRNRDAAAVAVNEGVLFDLQLGPARTWIGVDDNHGYLECKVLAGKELPNTVAQLH